MSAPSAARRVRSWFLRVGLWASAIAFLLIESYALQDQWAIGHASLLFMVGTALLSAAVCIGFFAIIAVVGLAASVFFSEQPPEQSQGSSCGIRPIDYSSNPRTFRLVKPDTIRRPVPVSKRKRYLRRLGS
jgi:hypothetical protein